MKKFIALTLVLFVFSCAKNKEENPILLPPNFAEMPDVNNPEKPTPAEKDENVTRLKELLLKSD